MSIPDILKQFVIDSWYKLLAAVSAVVLVASFFVEAKGISNTNLQLLSGGVLLLCIGIWKTHKQHSWIKPPNVYTGGAALITQTIRKWDFLSLVFVLIGLALIVFAVYNIAVLSQFITTVSPQPTLTP